MNKQLLEIIAKILFANRYDVYNLELDDNNSYLAYRGKIDSDDKSVASIYIKSMGSSWMCENFLNIHFEDDGYFDEQKKKDVLYILIGIVKTLVTQRAYPSITEGETYQLKINGFLTPRFKNIIKQ